MIESLFERDMMDTLNVLDVFSRRDEEGIGLNRSREEKRKRGASTLPLQKFGLAEHPT